MTIIKPKRLKAGDTLALLVPSSFIEEQNLQVSLDNLEKLGFKAAYTDEVLRRYGYFSGSDAQRAAIINNLFADKNIDAILCIRGGYGCIRLLPLLDYDLIRQNPKALIGYSDVTALLQGIFKETGLVGFHGPMGKFPLTAYTEDYFRAVLMSGSDPLICRHSQVNQAKAMGDEAYNPYIINAGQATGQLVGGNMSVMASLVGTPYDVDMRGKILFLEDTDEPPYSLDRMLTQFLLAGKLQQAAGIVFGIFTHCRPNENDPPVSLRTFFENRLQGLDIPIIYGLSFGHIDNLFTIPYGINAHLDTDCQCLTFTETAVV